METVKLDQSVFEIAEPKKHYLSENQSNVRKIPEGYMTGEEFFGKLRENITKTPFRTGTCSSVCAKYRGKLQYFRL